MQEQVSGITFLRWLTELEQDFPARFPALAEDLKALSRRVFCLKNPAKPVSRRTIPVPYAPPWTRTVFHRWARETVCPI